MTQTPAIRRLPALEEIKQYKCRLPAHGWVVENLYGGKKQGFYPLTQPLPQIYRTRKEAMSHALAFEKPVKVAIRRLRAAGREGK